MDNSSINQRLVKAQVNRNPPGTLLSKAIVGALAYAVAGLAVADDITGEDDFLCASASVTVCADDGSCTPTVPWELGIPDFIRVDVKERRMSTTETSGENRATEVDAVERANGHTYLHGVDGDRVFSLVIDDASGFMTAAIVRDGLTITVFGACTPTP